MKVYSTFEICSNMYKGLCEDCGDYNAVQPCDVSVPKHIPSSQIKKFVELIKVRISHEKT